MNQPPPGELLPKLRADLELLRGASTAAGEPSWLLHDPVQNRFIQIDFATFETLRYWNFCTTAQDLTRAVNSAGQVTLDKAGIDGLIGFLYAQRLTLDAPGSTWRHYAREAEARKQSVLMRLVHNYLFFRLPLFRPQAFLDATLPFVLTLGTPLARIAICLMGLAGIYLVSREWDVFITSMQDLFTWESLLVMALSLTFVKAAHELGHAYTAAAYGCRVHTMGVAFVLMAPLLYTDVSDSWRLRDRRKRFAIDSAGIKVELAIAAIALFFWAFLPDGPYRSAAFTLSVVSMASSLAVNLNPFMRFDGYYLLSDLIAVDNLQSRSFALARWQLRELLFKLGDEPPEPLTARLRKCLVLYAWATWLYRLILFVGIALLVYSYFFKVLGIILFAGEIIFFVGRPIMTEIKSWYRDRRRIVYSYRSYVSLVVTGLVIGACLVPWSTRIEIPAVIESAKLQPVHAGRPARITMVHIQQGSRVKAGDPLITLAAPDLDQEIELVRRKLALARLTYGRRGADAKDRESSIVLESSISGLYARLAGLRAERSELTLRAPFDGRVTDVEEGLAPGRWVSPRELLASVATTGQHVLRGYVSEHDLWRIATGATGTFIPEEPSRPSLSAKIEEIAASSTGEIKIPSLASIYSGRIPVVANAKEAIVPTAAQYQVRMSTQSDDVPQDLSVRGVVMAEGAAESILARVWRQTLKVLVRESGV